MVNEQVSVVKAHPNQFRPAELFSIPTTGEISASRDALGASID